MLALDDVHAHYGKSHVLHGVSLRVEPGEVVGLLGRNGVGKSTTLKAVMGLVRPSRGRVSLEGRDITRLPPHQLARSGIAWVPEDRRIFRLLTDGTDGVAGEAHVEAVHEVDGEPCGGAVGEGRPVLVLLEVQADAAQPQNDEEDGAAEPRQD